MKNRLFVGLLMVVIVFVFAFNGFTQDKEFKYIGSQKCKMCHNSKKSGEQYSIWENSLHSKAFTTLASEEAKTIAQKQGIEDPQKSEKCLTCHVTGYGKAASMFEASFSQDEGVGCEACHGPGSEYKSMKVMKGITAGDLKAADYGLVMPDEAACKTCHNDKSPTFKGFDYKTFYAKIAHPIPAAK